MTVGDALGRLAQAAGIETSYRDAWGRMRDVPHDTVCRLLAELGIAAESDADIAASLAALEERRFTRTAPPVVVVRERDLPARVTVCVAAAAPDATLAWELETEDGTTHSGAVRLAEMTLAERRGDGRERRVFVLPATPPAGYHALRVGDGETTLIVAPDRCYLPPALEGDGRTWGISLQLYALRSDRNWGMGDFGDLARLVDAAGARGAGCLALNPLHALYPGDPGRYSPYGPSSRLYLNTLYIDVEAVPEYDASAEAQVRVASEEFQARLAALRDAPLVDHAGVSACKARDSRAALRPVSRPCRTPPRRRRFEAFRAARGPTLRALAAFEALAERFGTEERSNADWRVWPEAFASARFARGRALRRRERPSASAISSICSSSPTSSSPAPPRTARDTAWRSASATTSRSGVDIAGAEAWTHQAALAQSIALGAPPDALNLKGQDWGLPPYEPRASPRAPMRPTWRCCAPTCARRARFGSTTCWASRASTGSRAAWWRPTAAMCGSRWTTCWGSSRWKAGATGAW